MAAEVSLQLEGNLVNENWGKKSCILGMELLHPETYSEAAAREVAVTISWLLLNGIDQQEWWLMLKKALVLGSCRCYLHSDHEFLTGGQASQDKMSVFQFKALF